MKRRNGFLEGRGGMLPSGRCPVKAANLDGVSSLAELGGALPVTLAMSVLIQRMSVKMPSTEPRVALKLPNCSATETIAKL